MHSTGYSRPTSESAPQMTKSNNRTLEPIGVTWGGGERANALKYFPNQKQFFARVEEEQTF
jgi:hypothetical protein